MNASIVRPVAERAVSALAPYCERVEIAGGLRRRSSDVHDIDIVAQYRGHDLPHLNRVIGKWQTVRGRQLGKSVTRSIQGVNVDISLVEPARWACILLIRTGCADFSHSVVSYARSLDRCFDGGRLRVLSTGTLIEVAEEEDVFRELGLPYVEPAKRTGTLRDILGPGYARSAR